MWKISNRRMPRRSCGGFSLIELMIAASIIAIALSSIISAMLSSMTLNGVNRETTLASQAARRQMEVVTASVRNGSVPAAFAALSLNPNFAVAGLNPLAGDPDGMTGQIQFPTLMVGGVLQLREDLDDPSLGMPRDLDGLNGIDGADHRADAQVLPVRVRIQWRTLTGDARTFDLETVLVAR